MAYKPKSKRTNSPVGPQGKKLLDGLTANKNIDDIRALSKISNTQSTSISNLNTEINSANQRISQISTSKQDKLTLTTVGTSGPATLNNNTLNVPNYSTGLTVGSTPISGGAVGRILFEGTGNVLQESANFLWDDAQVRFQLGTTSTRILNFRPEDTTGAYGNSSSIRGGNGNGRLDFYSATNITELRDNIIILTSVGGPSVQVGSSSIALNLGGTRLQVAPTTGNVLINTTTDAGFRLDVNGTARVVNQFQVGSFTVGAAGTPSTIVTTGRISAGGGITLYNPAAGDNQDTGIFPSGGVLIKHANSSVATFATIGGGSNGTNVAINQGYNPGAGTGSVIGYSHNYSLYPSADNTISYTSFYSRAYWNSAPYYNRITGPIRGFLFENSLYNTQKLIDLIAFQSNSGRLLFTGDLPAASVTSGVSRGLYLNQTHNASANNDVLVGLDIAPTYTNGAFTGLTNVDLRTKGAGVVIGSGAGYGAVYGYNNDGLFQFSTSGNNSVITLRPNNTAANYNSSYWSYIIQEGYSFKIIPGNYQSLYLRNPSVSGGVYVGGRENANSYGIYVPANTANVLINTTTDAGYKLDVNGTARVSGNITQAGANTAALGYITNGTLGVYSNAPGTGTVGILVGCVSNGGHTAIFTKGNNSGSTALRVTDQNVGASVNHLMVDFVGATGFGIANGTTVVNSSAQVEIQSTTKGFLPPRMSNAQMLAIATPSEGLVVYDLTNRKLCCYDGATWQNLF